MSRSYRSQKESVTAERRIERTRDGSPRLPHIIERAPAPGDSHPLPKRVLHRFLQRVPVEFIYGLSRIELRARELSLIGAPFGSYWVGERAIVLYSLPPVFHCRSLSSDFRGSLKRFHATIQSDANGVTVSWREPAVMSMWFYSFVFTHELGHHFVEQYKSKNSRIHSRNAEELVADLHAKRFTDELFASFRKRRSI
ncbi:MAG TPA: hypothetical protein VIS74_07525 [Chthoniobacterales bacterium]